MILFTLLVSVMLSAQTTDKKVNEVVPALFEVAPTPDKMALLEVEQIREIIQQIGLAPTKAKNLKAMSELLIERHAAEVPADIDALEALPGVGHKTASVVMAQGFGVPAFPVDTHIHRLAARWGLSSGKNVTQTECDLKSRVSRRDLDQAALADHLLWPRALPCAPPRPGRLPDLQLGRLEEVAGRGTNLRGGCPPFPALQTVSGWGRVDNPALTARDLADLFGLASGVVGRPGDVDRDPYIRLESECAGVCASDFLSHHRHRCDARCQPLWESTDQEPSHDP
jgi:endonuclease III